MIAEHDPSVRVYLSQSLPERKFSRTHHYLLSDTRFSVLSLSCPCFKVVFEIRFSSFIVSFAWPSVPLQTKSGISAMLVSRYGIFVLVTKLTQSLVYVGLTDCSNYIKKVTYSVTAPKVPTDFLQKDCWASIRIGISAS